MHLAGSQVLEKKDIHLCPCELVSLLRVSMLCSSSADELWGLKFKRYGKQTSVDDQTW